jgi:hypothetical protein
VGAAVAPRRIGQLVAGEVVAGELPPPVTARPCAARAFEVAGELAGVGLTVPTGTRRCASWIGKRRSLSLEITIAASTWLLSTSSSR